MCRARMTVVQECRKAVSDNGIIDRGREQLLLRIAREIRPNLECGTSEQFGELVLVHRELPCCGVRTASVRRGFLASVQRSDAKPVPRERGTIACLLVLGLCQLAFPTEHRPAAK